MAPRPLYCFRALRPYVGSGAAQKLPEEWSTNGRAGPGLPFFVAFFYGNAPGVTEVVRLAWPPEAVGTMAAAEDPQRRPRPAGGTGPDKVVLEDGLPAMPTRSKREHPVKIALKRQLADAVDYGLEYVPGPYRARVLAAAVDADALARVRTAIGDHDVVVVAEACG